MTLLAEGLNTCYSGAYSCIVSPGPNAPYSWILQSIVKLIPSEELKQGAGQKLLVGMNWYGYDFTKGGPQNAITGVQPALTLRDVCGRTNISQLAIKIFIFFHMG